MESDRTEKKSAIPKFYEKSLDERLDIVKKFANLAPEDLEALKKYAALEFSTANRMIENVIGTMQLPIGIATNFIVNGRDILVPMALEEPSVVAAASKAAGLARASGGFYTSADEPVMIGQVQLVGVDDPAAAATRINESKAM
ncbi:MAG: 3-hydroxy-3-methylglutaryl-CoA reductase, partial [Candidatus Micrarchaeia archaeon]